MYSRTVIIFCYYIKKIVRLKASSKKKKSGSSIKKIKTNKKIKAPELQQTQFFSHGSSKTAFGNLECCISQQSLHASKSERSVKTCLKLHKQGPPPTQPSFYTACRLRACMEQPHLNKDTEDRNKTFYKLMKIIVIFRGMLCDTIWKCAWVKLESLIKEKWQYIENKLYKKRTNNIKPSVPWLEHEQEEKTSSRTGLRKDDHLPQLAQFGWGVAVMRGEEGAHKNTSQ